MKSFKKKLTILSLLLALTGVLAPVQIVRADGDPPQGGSDSRSRQSQSSSEEAARAFWAWVIHMLRW